MKLINSTDKQYLIITSPHYEKAMHNVKCKKGT